MSSQSFDKLLKGIDYTKMYEEPSTLKSSFTCPHCFSKCQQKWYYISYFSGSGEKEGYYRGIQIGPPESKLDRRTSTFSYLAKMEFKGEIYFSVCTNGDCKKETIWVGDQIVYPQISIAPLPHKDMPPNVREVYEEARQVFSRSVRAACTLLRLSLEYLMDHLKVLSPKDNLGKRLKYLIEDGRLPNRVLKAMESIRVYGNDMVHNIREIQIDDDQKTALQLFHLVNYIIERTITEEKMVKDLYDPIPPNKKRVPENDPQESI